MTTYVTVQAYCDEYGYAETSALGQYRDLPKVTHALLRATVENTDRSAWSAEEQASADTLVTRIESVLNAAEEKVDSALRSVGMAVPLVTPGDLVTSIVMRIARYTLHREHPGQAIRQHYEDATEELGHISSGRLQLDPAADGNDGSSVGVSTEVAVGQLQNDTHRAFSRHTLRRYVRR